MCGFLTVYNKKNNLIEVTHLDEFLEHRGPDEKQSFFSQDRKIQMHFYRLSIIDLERGGQPVVDNSSGIVSVFNGEIYNYIELKQDLSRKGYSCKTNGDAEVINLLYREYGPQFVEHLQGMFTISLWDSQKEELHLYRDSFGIKQLYYAETDDHFFICSEIKPLLNLKGVSREIKEEAIFDYLSYGYTLGEYCFFKDIKKIPAATYIKIKNNQIIENECYWNYQQKLTEYTEEDVLSEFDQSIKLHLRSDVKLGAFLSGGIDSGMLIARAAQQFSNISTYTLNFKDAPVNESKVAEDIAERYGVQHKTFDVSYDDLFGKLCRAVWYCDEPIADSGILANFLISSFSQEDHCKVVLSGAGGDELFGGYSYHVRSGIERKLENFSKACRLLGHILPGDHGVKWSRTGSFTAKPDQHYLNHTRLMFNPELLNSRFKKYDNQNKIKWIKEFKGEHEAARLYADLRTYIPENLMVHFDRATMSYSLEGRVPFLHRPFAEMALSLPSNVRNPDGLRKEFLKNIAKKHLPKSVFDLPKIGFNSPVAQWMNGPIGRDMRSVIRSDSFLNRTFWSKNAITKYVQQDLPFHRVWSLFQLELFCRVHLDHKSNKEISNLNYKDLL